MTLSLKPALEMVFFETLLMYKEPMFLYRWKDRGIFDNFMVFGPLFIGLDLD